MTERLKNFALEMLPIAGILAVLVIFFYKFVFFGMVPLNADWLVDTFSPWKGLGLHVSAYQFNNDTDPVLYMYPIKFITIQIMKAGQLPLWNPSILCGAPLWGNNFATPMNPLNIVFFVLDFAKAWGIFLMLQFAVAGIGTYLFTRQLGMARLGASVASVAYMLNTAFVIWYQTIGYLGPYSWLPLALFASDRAFSRKSFLWAFWSGVTMAFFFWSGQIQIAVYSSVFAFAYLVFRCFDSSRKEPGSAGRRIALVAIAVATAALYSLPEILPQANNLLNSTRTPNRYGLTILYPQMLVTYLSPYFYGMKFDGWDVGFGTYIFNRGLIRLSPPYVGIMTLSLAAIGFVTRKESDRYFFLIFSAGVLAALMSFAVPLVSGGILKAIPFFTSVDHYRATTLYAFSIAVMAGWGCQAIFSGTGRRKLCLVTAIIVLVSIAALFAGLEAFSRVTPRETKAILSALGEKTASGVLGAKHGLKSVMPFLDYLRLLRREHGALIFSRNASIPLTFSFVSILLIAGALYGRRKALYGLYAFAFVTFDLLSYAFAFPAYSDPSHVFPATPSADFLKKDPALYRVVGYSEERSRPGGDVYPPNTGIPYGLSDIRGYENASQPRWYYRFIMGDCPDEIVVERFNDYRSKFLPFLNVKYLMAREEISADGWKKVYDREIKIYESARATPRTFVTRRVRIAKDGDEAYAMVRDPSFDPVREVVVEEKGGVRMPAPGLDGGPLRVACPEIVRYSPNEVVIRTDGAGSGVLVLADTYFPGWRVFVDGKEREVLKADYAFRAVRMADDEREVRFVFRPAWLYEILIACVGILAIVSILSLSRLFVQR